MNAKFTLGCDGFKAIYAFFILNRLFLGQMVDQGEIAVAALHYACYILRLTVWTKRHLSLLSVHRFEVHSKNIPIISYSDYVKN
jgi:hypothetical protein